MTQSPRVLVVLTQPPLPEGGAPGKTAIGLLRGLLAHGLQVQAIAARRHFDAAGEVPAGLPVEVVPVEPLGPVAARLGRYVRPRGELAGGRFAARVQELAREADVLHLEEAEAAWCDHGIDRPSLVHLHYLARRDRSYGAPWRREFRELVEYRLSERAAVRRHHYLAASSPLVAEALRREAPGADVTLAPLSLDQELYPQAPLDGPPVAGIIGTASWPPTATALRELLGEVWPLVRRRVPEARLLIAGRGTEAIAPSVDGVDVLGEVESARAFLSGLSLLLYPVARGSGMKVKVLEAIASGIPVVTTADGAEGIQAEGVTVRSTAAELADAAVAVLQDERLRRELGAAARRSFAERYSPEPATAPLVALYERMAG